MKPRQLTLLVIKPSAFSLTASLIASIALLAAANWIYVLHTFLFYDYFFGEEGLITAVRAGGGQESFTLGGAFFSQTFLNNLIVLLAAIGVGLIVFLILSTVQRLSQKRPPLPPKESKRRLAMRVLIFVLWAIYLQLTIKIILPFCILAAQVGIRALWGWQGFAYCLFGVVLLCLCLHAHVIFARLFLFRIRVFGASHALLEAEQRNALQR